MTVDIIRRKGIDDAEVVAVWKPEKGFVSGDLRFAEDPVYEKYDEEQILAEFDGPDFFAVPRDESRQKSLGGGA